MLLKPRILWRRYRNTPKWPCTRDTPSTSLNAVTVRTSNLINRFLGIPSAMLPSMSLGGRSTHRQAPLKSILAAPYALLPKSPLSAAAPLASLSQQLIHDSCIDPAVLRLGLEVRFCLVLLWTSFSLTGKYRHCNQQGR